MIPFFFYAQGRTDEIIAYATCALRGEYGEKAPLLDYRYRIMFKLIGVKAAVIY